MWSINLNSKAQKQTDKKIITAGISRGMVSLAVHAEAALLHGAQLLQLFVQHVHSLLHALPLRHGHLAHTAGHSKQSTWGTSIHFALCHVTSIVEWDRATLRGSMGQKKPRRMVEARLKLLEYLGVKKRLKSNVGLKTTLPSNTHWCFASLHL